MKNALDKHDLLKQYFGHDSFRNGQEELIDALTQGRDAFGIMPTGGGKSICYQLPALLMDGVALVISPLISLMTDQVMALKNVGVNAAFINSSLTAAQLKAVYRNLNAGKYKIVYVAPERLDGEAFIELAQSLEISLVAVDEAHCISQWGQDFRPSYLRILDFLEKLPRRPVLAAFTATATLQVREDVERILKMRKPLCITTGFDRPNLHFEMLHPKKKDATLNALLNQRRGKSGIIYCSTRNAVEKICAALLANGVLATRYHAGLPDAERRQNQEDFLYDRFTIMVATNAFGMGIDKSNVGFVVHYSMPKSLEAYYQEAGRAGRDGEKADCILLYSAGDIQTAKFLIQGSANTSGSRGNAELTAAEKKLVMQRDHARLNVMMQYCKTTTCLRAYILNYFGQNPDAHCGNCGNCATTFAVKDITSEAQMVLSCVKRVKDKLGYGVGAALLVRTLYGSADARLVGLGLDTLTTYGLLKGKSKTGIGEIVACLEEQGYLSTDPRHGGVSLTLKSKNVLFNGVKVEITVRELPKIIKREGKKAVTGNAGVNAVGNARANNVAKDEPNTSVNMGTNVSANAGENDLFTALKALRFQLAKQEKVPAYIVFSNASLADMAAKMPKSLAEFLEVSGVGEVKAARYGKFFLAEIMKYGGGSVS